MIALTIEAATLSDKFIALFVAPLGVKPALSGVHFPIAQPAVGPMNACSERTPGHRLMIH
jgi:hypothetical protein